MNDIEIINLNGEVISPYNSTYPINLLLNSIRNVIHIKF